MSNPQSRTSAVASQIVDSFIEHTSEEDSKMAEQLRALDGQGRVLLAGVLGRFDLSHHGELRAQERLLARRVLGRLKKITTDTLSLMNKILDYLDLNSNAVLEADELALAVEVLELFTKAESDNDTLSERELRMLYAVLRHLDADSSGRLEKHERAALRRGLDDPKLFLSEQRLHNPLLREITEITLG